MKKLFLPILMLLSCVSCNNSNNNDVTEFVVYEENEKFLIKTESSVLTTVTFL